MNAVTCQVSALRHSASFRANSIVSTCGNGSHTEPI